MTPEKHKIINRDGALLEVEAADAGDARTLAHMAGDLPHANDAMPDCTGHDHSLFLRYLPRAKEIAIRKKNQGPLVHETIQNLAAIATSADYYESPGILNRSVSLLANRLLYDDRVFNYFGKHGTFPIPELPPLVNEAVVKKFIKNCANIKVVLLEEQKRRRSKEGCSPTQFHADLGSEWSDPAFSFTIGELTFLNSPLRIVLTQCSKALRIVDTNTKNVVLLHDHSLGKIETARLTSDHLKVVTTHGKEESLDNNYAFALWNACDGRQLWNWKHAHRMSPVANSDAGIIVSIDTGGLVILDECPSFLKLHDAGISNVIALSAQRDKILSGSNGGELTLCEWPSRSKISSCFITSAPIIALACHPHKDCFAARA